VVPIFAVLFILGPLPSMIVSNAEAKHNAIDVEAFNASIRGMMDRFEAAFWDFVDNKTDIYDVGRIAHSCYLAVKNIGEVPYDDVKDWKNLGDGLWNIHLGISEADNGKIGLA